MAIARAVVKQRLFANSRLWIAERGLVGDYLIHPVQKTSSEKLRVYFDVSYPDALAET